MSQLLCIPFKRSLNVDLKSELSKVIDGTFYQVASVFSDDMAIIAKLRESALEAEVSLSGLQRLKDYYIQFSQLKKKFPDHQLTFKWFETLGLKSYGREDSRFLFEELNIIYNIGALYSLLSADVNNGTPEGLKTACVYSRSSAGCFGFICSQLEGMQDPVMEPKSVKCLEYLMLAQAQEIFWFKAVKDGLKDSLIARLALQVSEYYDIAFKCASTSELIRSDWQNRFKEKFQYFRAVAMYRYSLSCEDKTHCGHKVKALRDAMDLIQLSTLQENSTRSLRDRIQDSLKSAERDNDLIYLQAIPASTSNLKPAPMASPIYFEGLEDPLNALVGVSGGGTLFKDLLPSSVMESSNAFNQRQELYIQEHIVDPLDALNRILNDSLPKNDITGNLHPISSEELDTCQLSMKEGKLNSQQISNVLKQASELLAQESDTDQLLRSKYGTLKWTMLPSEKVNSEYWSRYAKIQSYLKMGESIDEETTQLFDSIDKNLLTAPIKLPESNNPLLKEVSAAFRRRESIIATTRKKANDSVLLPKIISAYKRTGQLDFEDLFADHLKMFSDDLGQIENEKRSNKEILGLLKIESHNNTKVQRLDVRDLFVQDFRHSLKLLESVKENVKGGSKFYQDLVSSVSSLLNDVRLFEAQRREEKRKSEEIINKL
ncbi:LANO_0H16930g1_1 [Lachancea nothofagi CBS 11611]|uniref:LANO_0H16930g1_1 n=1 Tax=Lachancea nothofagi CBS 11611 TaxID=1266666 RepID=A0A1G4KN63_9SACH|nr:LANO_0H16930g1_1 [Lachancea nothofagi CBS 11611]